MPDVLSHTGLPSNPLNWKHFCKNTCACAAPRCIIRKVVWLRSPRLLPLQGAVKEFSTLRVGWCAGASTGDRPSQGPICLQFEYSFPCRGKRRLSCCSELKTSAPHLILLCFCEKHTIIGSFPRFYALMCSNIYCLRFLYSIYSLSICFTYIFITCLIFMTAPWKTKTEARNLGLGKGEWFAKLSTFLAGSSVSTNPGTLIFHDSDLLSFACLLALSHSPGDFEFHANFMASPSTDELCLGEDLHTLEDWSSPMPVHLGNSICQITAKGQNSEIFSQVLSSPELALISSLKKKSSSWVFSWTS